jgi:hypothetical protein
MPRTILSPMQQKKATQVERMVGQVAKAYVNKGLDLRNVTVQPRVIEEIMAKAREITSDLKVIRAGFNEVNRSQRNDLDELSMALLSEADRVRGVGGFES